MTDMIVMTPGFELTRIGMVVHGPPPPIDEWLAFGMTLRDIGTALQWAIGDWLAFGEERYGERYAQGQAMTGYDPGYLRNLVWVARAIPMSRRNDKIKWSLHQCVAPLPESEQVRLLTAAEAGGWTRAEMRRAIDPADDDGGGGIETVRLMIHGEMDLADLINSLLVIQRNSGRSVTVRATVKSVVRSG